MVTWASILSVITSFFNLIRKYPKNTIIIILSLVIVYLTQCTRERDCPSIEQITPKPLIFPTITYVPDMYILPGKAEIHFVYDTIEKIRWKTEYEKDKGDSLKLQETYKRLWTPVFSSDTLQDDTLAFIAVHDKLVENRIKSRTVEKTIYPRLFTTKYKPRIQLYAGLGIGGWIDKFGFSAKVVLKTKKENIIGISYDPLNNFIEGSYYIKIRLKKQE